MHTTVSTAFAYQVVDQHANGRIDHGSALASATLFRRTGLVIDDDGATLDFTHFALYLIEQSAVVHLDVGHQIGAIVFFWLICHDSNTLSAFCAHALRNLQCGVALRALANRLAACHGDCIVVQNFVSDIDASRHALAYRQDAAMEVGAVTNVGKNMLVVDKRLLSYPWRSFATHLGKPRRTAVHPQRHEVTTNTRHRARTFRYFGAGVVRAARAEPRLAIRCDHAHTHRLLFGSDDGELRIDARRDICIHT